MSGFLTSLRPNVLVQPLWYRKLPTILGKKAILLDTNAVSARYFRKSEDPELSYIFESPEIRPQIPKQVIYELLCSDKMNGRSRATIFQELAKLQGRDKIFLSGFSQMTRQQFDNYTAVWTSLNKCSVSQEDSRVFADGIVKGVPIFTFDIRSQQGLAKAFKNKDVRKLMEKHGYNPDVEEIIANLKI